MKTNANAPVSQIAWGFSHGGTIDERIFKKTVDHVTAALSRRFANLSAKDKAAVIKGVLDELTKIGKHELALRKSHEVDLATGANSGDGFAGTSQRQRNLHVAGLEPEDFFFGTPSKEKMASARALCARHHSRGRTGSSNCPYCQGRGFEAREAQRMGKAAVSHRPRYFLPGDKEL